MAQFDTHDAPDHLKFVISKIKDGCNRHHEKSKNRHFPGAVRAISTKFGTVTHFDLLHRSDCEINLVQKLQQ